MICKFCRCELPEGSAYCCRCGKSQGPPARRPRTRGNGSGTVFWRQDRKCWVAQASYYDYVRSPDGLLTEKIRRRKTLCGFKTKRDALAAVIRATPGCAFAVASASALEIDQTNILRATHLAMRRAARMLAETLDIRRPTSDAPSSPSTKRQVPSTPYRILVDGLPVPSLPFPSRNLVKGDAKSLFIAAASILAKTARDAYCLGMETRFPGYGFAVHKGYPTPAHLAALERLGPCPEHRQSFGPVAEAVFFRGGA